MTYQVLARKWRPRKFAELVGQAHVVKALSNGLAEGRVHHAFLFTGTRGVGKTTIARILAKSLNCLEGVSAEPCGKCDHCVDIDEGRFVDLLEIDAASRTKVDDTREMLDNVPYAPNRGRYKVYLIDEVHMLSGHSFNALLKTLEEPPEHVKFLLATTDPQKVPVTVLSRCLQFNLRRLESEEITGQFEKILEQEGVAADAEALRLLARAADGSMRDGLSLLDQALASGSGSLALEDVRAMLGSVESRHVLGLLEAVADRDAGRALEVLAEVYGLARDLGRLLADVAEYLHRIAVLQQLPELKGADDEPREELLALAGRMAPEDVQLYYQIAVQGRRDLDLAPDARTGCEMTVLRMLAFAPVDAETLPEADISDPPQESSRSGPTAANAEVPDVAARGPLLQEAPAPYAVKDEPRADAPAIADSRSTRNPQPTTRDSNNWPEILSELKVSGAVRTVASHLALKEHADSVWCFSVSPELKTLLTNRFKKDLETALEDWSGSEVRLKVEAGEQQAATPAAMEQEATRQRQSEAESAIESDPVVRQMKERFGASVVPGSVKPL